MKRLAIDGYAGPTALAIDVSAHQGTIDWPAVARSEATIDGVSQGRPRLVIVRTSDGVQTRPSSRPDPMAVRNLRGAHEAGFRCGIYHFMRAHHDAREQSELMLEAIAVAGVPIVFAAIDVEGRPDNVATTKDESAGAWWRPPGGALLDEVAVLHDVDVMRAELERRGHRVLIYSGVAWHYYIAQRRMDVQRFASLPLWVPDYEDVPRPRLPVDPRGFPAPWPEWTLWQYSSQGRINGIAGNVDLNRFRGDDAKLEEWCGPRQSFPADPRAALQRELDALRVRYPGAYANVLREAQEQLAKVAP